jgi:pimeloyl-ACP methyl ester carboxylesterase
MGFFKAYTPPFKVPEGEKNNSIAEMRSVSINGLQQAILIRGENKNNPLLLLLHGGPGLAETGLFRYYNAPLEKHFVVVYWDQRGSGKSYTRQTATAPLSVDLFVQDTIELTRYLLQQFGKDKLFLFAHSWGTLLGTIAISQHPEYYEAYVGSGQVSSMPAGELESYRFTLKTAVEQRNQPAITELEAIGEPQDGAYLCGMKGTRIERKWLTYFGGALYGAKNWNPLFWKIIQAKEYSLADIDKLLKGMNAPARNELSEKEFLHVDLTKAIKKLNVPVYFFLGKHDYQIPSILAENYLSMLDAPKKSLVWFDRSAHSPCFEEAGKFNSLMINMVLTNSI